MQDITEWANTFIIHNLSGAAGHPTVQADDYFYSQIFSLCCCLANFSPLSASIALHNFLSLCPVTTGLKLIFGQAGHFPLPFRSLPSVRRDVEVARERRRKPTHTSVTTCNYLEFPSHKVLPKPLFCHLRTLTLRTSLLPEHPLLRLQFKFVWSWSPPKWIFTFMFMFKLHPSLFPLLHSLFT